MKKICKGKYEYKGYYLCNCGYHQPDHCVWWEAVDIRTGCAMYHAKNRKKLIEMIDKPFD